MRYQYHTDALSYQMMKYEDFDHIIGCHLPLLYEIREVESSDTTHESGNTHGH